MNSQTDNVYLIDVPVLFAISVVVNDFDVDKDAVRQCGAEGDEPYGADGDAAGGHLHARPERVQDHEEPIDSDRSQCQRRHVNRRALCVKRNIDAVLSISPDRKLTSVTDSRLIAAALKVFLSFSCRGNLSASSLVIVHRRMPANFEGSFNITCICMTLLMISHDYLQKAGKIFILSYEV